MRELSVEPILSELGDRHAAGGRLVEALAEDVLMQRGPNALKIRGYLAVKLLGQSQIWTHGK